MKKVILFLLLIGTVNAEAQANALEKIVCFDGLFAMQTVINVDILRETFLMTREQLMEGGPSDKIIVAQGHAKVFHHDGDTAIVDLYKQSQRIGILIAIGGELAPWKSRVDSYPGSPTGFRFFGRCNLK